MPKGERETNQNGTSPTLCRDCGTVGAFVRRCPSCGGARLIRHAELLSLSIAHLDCDAFFASIEKRDRPELADKPVIVGGGQRGVVATCCYVARAYGIRSAMPMFKALKLCPHAVVVRSRFDAYREAAMSIRAAMADLTPLVQPLSIDEAFLDLSGTERLHGRPPAATLALLARRIETEVGITVSIGLAPNKMLAKIASDLDKPRGFHIIGAAEAAGFLARQPPGILPGIGPAFAEKLERSGIRTLEQIQNADPRELMKTHGEYGLKLHRMAWGQDDRPVRVDRETKSVSGETTFGEDITDRAALEEKLYTMAKKVAVRAKEKALAGRVVTLKLKTARFRSFTRRKSLPHHTNLLRVIYQEGLALLHAEIPGAQSREAYRLIGIGISELIPAAHMDADFLFSDDHRRWRKQEDALDALRARYGEAVIGTLRDRTTAKPRRKDDTE